MYIGYMGDIVFVVSPNYMLTPMDYERESTGRWTEHDLLMRKPVSQFGGPGLEKLTFSIILDAAHNIDVAKCETRARCSRSSLEGSQFHNAIGGWIVSRRRAITGQQTDVCSNVRHRSPSQNTMTATTKKKRAL